MTPGDELIFLPLGGSGEIGMNVNLYGCQGKWVMVDLGMTFGDPRYPGIDVVLPDLAFIEERRKDLAKIAGKYSEQQKIAVRNVRRDANEDLKKAEKAGVIAQDEQKRMETEVQKITDEAIKRIDEALKVKEQEIMQV
jgi:ribosome recycling factor